MNQKLFFTLLGAVIGYWLRTARESYLKRSRFHNYIERRLKTLATIGANDFVHEHGNWRDIDKFEAEVLEVGQHIFWFNQARFKCACAAYTAVQFTGHEQQDSEAKAKLMSVLSELLKCVKWF